MSYPIGTDLIDRLRGEKPSEARANKLVLSAVAAWETATRWKPFLATAGTLVCDGPLSDGLEIFPRSGIISLSAVKLGPDLELLDPSYWRLNRPKDGCYLSVYFPSGQWPGYGAIVLEGTFGRFPEGALPPDVEDAILAHAMASWYSEDQGSGAAVKKEKAGPVEFEYATEAGRDPVGRNMAVFTAAAKQYKRWL